MNNDDKQIYTARITQASRSELVVIMYEIMLKDIEAAKKAYEKGEFELLDKKLKHIQKILSELMGTLNFKYIISLDLMQLYMYSSKRVVTAIMKKNVDTLDSVEKVLASLLLGFEGVSKEDNSGPVMENTQQLYAGLTYGRGVLNESFIDPNGQQRGYKA